jgi:ABC-type branched-subunit amino acid transport system permease subunit
MMMMMIIIIIIIVIIIIIWKFFLGYGGFYDLGSVMWVCDDG